MDDTPTTADYLGRYRKELLEQGIPAEVADALVRDAAHDLVGSDGLRVKRDA